MFGVGGINLFPLSVVRCNKSFFFCFCMMRETCNYHLRMCTGLVSFMCNYMQITAEEINNKKEFVLAILM